MNNMERLRRISRIMAWLSLASAVLYLAGEVCVYIFPDLSSAVDFIQIRNGVMPVTSTTPLAFRVAALAVDLIPAGLVVWALIALHRLFSLYGKGEVFSSAALAALNRVAVLMFWEVLVSIVAQVPVSFLLSWSTKQHAISVGLGSGDFTFLFMAGVVLTIARVMGEARRVADENASFV
ncbi:MAG TPA: DUF2975 domain-containing protein [Rhizomicrobium sp.]|jgi:hypothetical protein|nr:DUF2975 domain-containing protein [Rhizomicrobium sp.]